MALQARHCRGRGLGAAHAAKLLALDHQLTVTRQTLWRWLKAAGLMADSRRVSRHRIRRPRKSHVGELVQMDGSTHAWLGPGRDSCGLFVMIDDASSRVWARGPSPEVYATARCRGLAGRGVDTQANLADRTPWRPGPNHLWKRMEPVSGAG